jgi:hypothetical protein
MELWHPANVALDCNSMKRVPPTLNLRVALAAAGLSFAAAAPNPLAAAQHGKGAECAIIDDSTARLACFDAAFPRSPRSGSQQSAAPPALQGATDAVAATATASKVDKFGLSNEQLAAREAKPSETPLAATTTLVKTVRRLPSGYLLISLDNDQIWQQTEIDNQVWLRPDDRVTIRRASLGSYLLVTPAQYSTRVRRIK